MISPGGCRRLGDWQIRNLEAKHGENPSYALMCRLTVPASVCLAGGTEGCGWDWRDERDLFIFFSAAALENCLDSRPGHRACTRTDRPRWAQSERPRQAALPAHPERTRGRSNETFVSFFARYRSAFQELLDLPFDRARQRLPQRGQQRRAVPGRRRPFARPTGERIVDKLRGPPGPGNLPFRLWT